MDVSRKTRWTRSLGVALAITALIVAGLFILMGSFMTAHPALETLVEPASSAPTGFVVDAANSGPLDRKQLQDSGLSSEAADVATGYRRVWRDDGTGQVVQVIVYDLGVSNSIASFLDEFHRKAAQIGLSVDQAGVPGSVRATGFLDTGNGRVATAVTAFGRGPVLIVVSAAGPDESVSSLGAAVTNRQADLVSSRYAGAPSSTFDGAEAAGVVAGGLLFYIVLIGAWAWFRDPLRRAKSSGTWSPRPLGPGPVLAVDTAARRLQRRAMVLVVMQVASLVLIASALFPNDPVVRATLVILGCLLWAGAFMRSGARSQRWAKALPWNLASIIALVAGLICLASGAREQSANSTGVAALFFFAAAAISHRWGGRISARAAREALARDPRPAVLFLRSFGDDKCRLRSGLGRQSLIEKLAPNRFDSFEEVLVRHLTRLGPVVALNPPGTQLSPIGAARATLSSDDWQEQIVEWVERARLVVVAAPPERVTRGLMWELERISLLGQWGKTAVVVPPVPDDEVRRRWEGLSRQTAQQAPFDHLIPADPASAQMLVFEIDRWVVATATRRTEWTYAAALQELASWAHAPLRPDTGLKA